MWPGFHRLVFRLQCWMSQVDGQDIVEYALVISLIALLITVSNRAVANVVSTAFSNLATQFSATV
jgi:Flp pilus assembly pilin Flp